MAVTAALAAWRDVVATVVNQVSTARLRQDVLALERMERRAEYVKSAVAADYVRQRLIAAGYGRDEVRFVAFPFQVPQQNVLYAPLRFTKPTMLIGAHYDSTTTEAGRAPGADDNASGIAAMLEVARLVYQMPLSHDILFAAFGAEESRRAGSLHMAMVAAAQRWPLGLMINLDMVGVPVNGRDIVIECEPPSPDAPLNDAATRAFGAVMMQMAQVHTSLNAVPGGLRESDHLSFEQVGIPAIGVFEGRGNPCWHKGCDTSSTLDMTYLTDVVKMVLATVLTLAR